MSLIILLFVHLAHVNAIIFIDENCSSFSNWFRSGSVSITSSCSFNPPCFRYSNDGTLRWYTILNFAEITSLTLNFELGTNIFLQTTLILYIYIKPKQNIQAAMIAPVKMNFTLSLTQLKL